MGVSVVKITRFLALAGGSLIAATSFLAHGEDLPKARLSTEKTSVGVGTGERIQLPSVILEGGSELSIVTPRNFYDLAQRVSYTLRQSHSELASAFGEIPQFKTSVQLMDEDTFFLATGAPRWTNALFFRGQIILPLSQGERIDVQNVVRSVRHEYTHAVIHNLTLGACPGWLDEGLAQWQEGPVHPAIEKALNTWLTTNAALPLATLQSGFTKLDQRIVPAAYAQSLWMTKYLMSRYSVSKVKEYFAMLRSGGDREGAFMQTFALSTKDFEQRTKRLLEAKKSF